jgi:hypothetical protein
MRLVASFKESDKEQAKELDIKDKLESKKISQVRVRMGVGKS